MAQAASPFTMTTLQRKRVEKFRRKDKDARVYARLSALLWLADARPAEAVAALLDVCPRTLGHWLDLYRAGGLDLLRRLDYKGDPG